jgi:hypothetical protein
MQYLLLVLLAMPLAGCLRSSEEVRAEIAAKDDQECRSYGAQPGSPAYVQCRATRASAHEAAAATMAAAPPPPPAPAAPSAPSVPTLAPLPPRPQRCATTHLGMGQYRTNLLLGRPRRLTSIISAVTSAG